MLPIESDFDPYNGCLDAQSAWKHFGGKTLGEAHELFRKNPTYYQEDFMFMGHTALAYYFPVIDRYLRDDNEDCLALIIAQALELQFQFENDDRSQLEKIKRPIIDLSNFIIQNIERYGQSPVEKSEIKIRWQNLSQILS